MVEYERRFGGLAMTQLDRLYRGADGVAKPGRLLAHLIAWVGAKCDAGDARA